MQDNPEWREMFQKFSFDERTAFDQSFEEEMWEGLVKDESTVRFYRILNTQLAKSDEAQKKNFVKATEFMMEKIDKWATMMAIMSDESPDPERDFWCDKFLVEESFLKSLNKNFKHEKNWKNFNRNDYLRIADSLETFSSCMSDDFSYYNYFTCYVEHMPVQELSGGIYPDKPPLYS